MNTTTQSGCKISYSELVTDAARSCSDTGGLGGLLIVGGSEPDVRRLKEDFFERTQGKYPAIAQSREEFEQSENNRQIGEKKLYLIELDKIKLV
jgi:hypothetical protein